MIIRHPKGRSIAERQSEAEKRSERIAMIAIAIGVLVLTAIVSAIQWALT
jgi:hypothetical protein